MRKVAIVSLVLFLAACDPVTYGEIVIDAQIPFDRQCLIGVQKQLSDVTDKGSTTPSGELNVIRGFDVVRITPNVGATSLTLSFKWLGRSKAEEERGDFQLLDDLHSAIVRSCLSNESRATVRRRCSARLCEEWLMSHDNQG